jgi:hypothetical protein
MRRIHGRLNEANWSDASCEMLKSNLEQIYTRLRWLLLNVGAKDFENVPRANLNDLGWMLRGDPMADNKIAVIEDQGNYYLTDRIPQ